MDSENMINSTEKINLGLHSSLYLGLFCFLLSGIVRILYAQGRA
jgi:uncharacterized protein with PQ loop repeat